MYEWTCTRLVFVLNIKNYISLTKPIHSNVVSVPGDEESPPILMTMFRPQPVAQLPLHSVVLSWRECAPTCVHSGSLIVDWSQQVAVWEGRPDGC